MGIVARFYIATQLPNILFDFERSRPGTRTVTPHVFYLSYPLAAIITR